MASTSSSEKIKLVIGDKNFSSWSMRPWLVLKTSQLPFEEINIPLDRPNTAAKIRKFSPTGRVPVLWHGEEQIWDSLAICEYIHELAPERYLWPRARSERAHARSIVAEMHSQFSALRAQLSMDLRLKQKALHLLPDTVADIQRILKIWSECLRSSKGDFLFGGFGIADAFFAPVVFRFLTYGIDIRNERILKYMENVKRDPSVREWVQGARAEKLFEPVFR